MQVCSIQILPYKSNFYCDANNSVLTTIYFLKKTPKNNTNQECYNIFAS
jgi:hypothetical protein